jgi:hypothetical protein
VWNEPGGIVEDRGANGMVYAESNGESTLSGQKFYVAFVH